MARNIPSTGDRGDGALALAPTIISGAHLASSSGNAALAAPHSRAAAQQQQAQRQLQLMQRQQQRGQTLIGKHNAVNNVNTHNSNRVVDFGEGEREEPLLAATYTHAGYTAAGAAAAAAASPPAGDRGNRVNPRSGKFTAFTSTPSSALPSSSSNAPAAVGGRGGELKLGGAFSSTYNPSMLSPALLASAASSLNGTTATTSAAASTAAASPTAAASSSPFFRRPNPIAVPMGHFNAGLRTQPLAVPPSSHPQHSPPMRAGGTLAGASRHVGDESYMTTHQHTPVSGGGGGANGNNTPSKKTQRVVLHSPTSPPKSSASPTQIQRNHQKQQKSFYSAPHADDGNTHSSSNSNNNTFYCTRREHEEEIAAFTERLSALYSSKLAEQRDALVGAIMTRAAAANTVIVRRQSLALASAALGGLNLVAAAARNKSEVSNNTANGTAMNHGNARSSPSSSPAAASPLALPTAKSSAILSAKESPPKGHTNNIVITAKPDLLFVGDGEGAVDDEEKDASDDGEDEVPLIPTMGGLSPHRAGQRTRTNSVAAAADGSSKRDGQLTDDGNSNARNRKKVRMNSEAVVIHHREPNSQQVSHLTFSGGGGGGGVAGAGASSDLSALEAFATDLIISKFGVDGALAKRLLASSGVGGVGSTSMSASIEYNTKSIAGIFGGGGRGATPSMPSAGLPSAFKRGGGGGSQGRRVSLAMPAVGGSSPAAAAAAELFSASIANAAIGGAFGSASSHDTSIETGRGSFVAFGGGGGSATDVGAVVAAATPTPTAQSITGAAASSSPQRRNGSDDWGATASNLVSTLTRKGVSIAIDPIQKERLAEEHRQQLIIEGEDFRRELNAAISSLKLAAIYLGEDDAKGLLTDVVLSSYAFDFGGAGKKSSSKGKPTDNDNSGGVDTVGGALIQSPKKVVADVDDDDTVDVLEPLSVPSPLAQPVGAASATLREMLTISCAEAALRAAPQHQHHKTTPPLSLLSGLPASLLSGGGEGESLPEKVLLASTPALRQWIERRILLESMGRSLKSLLLLAAGQQQEHSSAQLNEAALFWSPRDALRLRAAKRATINSAITAIGVGGESQPSSSGLGVRPRKSLILLSALKRRSTGDGGKNVGGGGGGGGERANGDDPNPTVGDGAEEGEEEGESDGPFLSAELNAIMRNHKKRAQQQQQQQEEENAEHNATAASEARESHLPFVVNTFHQQLGYLTPLHGAAAAGGLGLSMSLSSRRPSQILDGVLSVPEMILETVGEGSHRSGGGETAEGQRSSTSEAAQPSSSFHPAATAVYGEQNLHDNNSHALAAVPPATATTATTSREAAGPLLTTAPLQAMTLKYTATRFMSSGEGGGGGVGGAGGQQQQQQHLAAPQNAAEKSTADSGGVVVTALDEGGKGAAVAQPPMPTHSRFAASLEHHDQFFTEADLDSSVATPHTATLSTYSASASASHPNENPIRQSSNNAVDLDVAAASAAGGGMSAFHLPFTVATTGDASSAAVIPGEGGEDGAVSKSSAANASYSPSISGFGSLSNSVTKLGGQSSTHINTSSTAAAAAGVLPHFEASTSSPPSPLSPLSQTATAAAATRQFEIDGATMANPEAMARLYAMAELRGHLSATHPEVAALLNQYVPTYDTSTGALIGGGRLGFNSKDRSNGDAGSPLPPSPTAAAEAAAVVALPASSLLFSMGSKETLSNVRGQIDMQTKEHNKRARDIQIKIRQSLQNIQKSYAAIMSDRKGLKKDYAEACAQCVLIDNHCDETAEGNLKLMQVATNGYNALKKIVADNAAAATASSKVGGKQSGRAGRRRSSAHSSAASVASTASVRSVNNGRDDAGSAAGVTAVSAADKGSIDALLAEITAETANLSDINAASLLAPPLLHPLLVIDAGAAPPATLGSPIADSQRTLSSQNLGSSAVGGGPSHLLATADPQHSAIATTTNSSAHHGLLSETLAGGEGVRSDGFSSTSLSGEDSFDAFGPPSPTQNAGQSSQQNNKQQQEHSTNGNNTNNPLLGAPPPPRRVSTARGVGNSEQRRATVLEAATGAANNVSTAAEGLVVVGGAEISNEDALASTRIATLHTATCLSATATPAPQHIAVGPAHASHTINTPIATAASAPTDGLVGTSTSPSAPSSPSYPLMSVEALRTNLGFLLSLGKEMAAVGNSAADRIRKRQYALRQLKAAEEEGASNCGLTHVYANGNANAVANGSIGSQSHLHSALPSSLVMPTDPSDAILRQSAATVRTYNNTDIAAVFKAQLLAGGGGGGGGTNNSSSAAARGERSGSISPTTKSPLDRSGNGSSGASTPRSPTTRRGNSSSQQSSASGTGSPNSTLSPAESDGEGGGAPSSGGISRTVSGNGSAKQRRSTKDSARVGGGRRKSSVFTTNNGGAANNRGKKSSSTTGGGGGNDGDDDLGDDDLSMMEGSFRGTDDDCLSFSMSMGPNSATTPKGSAALSPMDTSLNLAERGGGSGSAQTATEERNGIVKSPTGAAYGGAASNKKQRRGTTMGSNGSNTASRDPSPLSNATRLSPVSRQSFKRNAAKNAARAEASAAAPAPSTTTRSSSSALLRTPIAVDSDDAGDGLTGPLLTEGGNTIPAQPTGGDGQRDADVSHSVTTAAVLSPSKPAVPKNNNGNSAPSAPRRINANTNTATTNGAAGGKKSPPKASGGKKSKFVKKKGAADDTSVLTDASATSPNSTAVPPSAAAASISDPSSTIFSTAPVKSALKKKNMSANQHGDGDDESVNRKRSSHLLDDMHVDTEEEDEAEASGGEGLSDAEKKQQQQQQQQNESTSSPPSTIVPETSTATQVSSTINGVVVGDNGLTSPQPQAVRFTEAKIAAIDCDAGAAAASVPNAPHHPFASPPLNQRGSDVASNKSGGGVPSSSSRKVSGEAVSNASSSPRGSVPSPSAVGAVTTTMSASSKALPRSTSVVSIAESRTSAAAASSTGGAGAFASGAFSAYSTPGWGAAAFGGFDNKRKGDAPRGDSNNASSSAGGQPLASIANAAAAAGGGDSSLANASRSSQYGGSKSMISVATSYASMSIVNDLTIGGRSAAEYLGRLQSNNDGANGASSSRGGGKSATRHHSSRRGGKGSSSNASSSTAMNLPPYSIPRRTIDVGNITQMSEILASESAALREALEEDKRRLEARARAKNAAFEMGDVDAQLRYAIFDDSEEEEEDAEGAGGGEDANDPDAYLWGGISDNSINSPTKFQVYQQELQQQQRFQRQQKRLKLTDVDRFRIRQTLARSAALLEDLSNVQNLLNRTIIDKNNVKDELQAQIDGEITDCETVMVRTNAEIRKAKMGRRDLVTKYWEWRKAREIGDWRAAPTFYQDLQQGPKQKEIGIQVEIQTETLPMHLRRFVKLMKKEGDLNARLVWLEVKLGELENATQRIAVELICPICHETFHDPVLMKPCGHAYCQSCFERAPELRLFPGDNSIFQCTVCGVVTTEPASLSDHLLPEVIAKFNVRSSSYKDVGRCLRNVKIFLTKIQQRSVKKCMSQMSNSMLVQHMMDEGIVSDSSPIGGGGGGLSRPAPPTAPNPAAGPSGRRL